MEPRHKKIITGNILICIGIVFFDLFTTYIAYNVPYGYLVFGIMFFIFGVLLKMMILHPEDRLTCREESKEERHLIGKWHIKIPIGAILIILINIAVFIPTGDSTPWKKVLAQHAPEIYDGQVWRMITAMFLHDNFGHIFGNMLCLFIFAQLTEYLVGTPKFFAAYFFSGIAGGILSLLTTPRDIYCLGASGAVFGIAGYLIGLTFHKKEYIFYTVSRLIIPFAALELTTNLIAPGNVSVSAHLGGFVGGIIFALITGRKTYLKHDIEDFERHVF